MQYFCQVKFSLIVFHPMKANTLIGSITSPYVRKLRLFFLHEGINFTLKSINYLDEHDAKFLSRMNPINKIPVLITPNEEIIFDSRIIFNYFSSTKLTLKEENLLSAIDGGLNSAINLFSLRRGGLDIDDNKNSFIVREKERILQILNFLEKEVETGNGGALANWNFISMSLYSFLDWGLFRQMIELSESSHPHLKKFIENHRNRSEVISTAPSLS